MRQDEASHSGDDFEVDQDVECVIEGVVLDASHPVCVQNVLDQD